MSAATVYISETNLVGAVVTDNITNINFVSVDAANSVAANHPVVISEYSYRKYLRFKVQSLGTSTTIKDLRFWKSAGAYVTGEVINYDCSRYNIGGVLAYATPVAANVSSNQALLTVDPGSEMPSIGGVRPGGTFQSAAPPGDVAVPGYCDYFNFVTQSTGSTPAGAANTKTILFQYDES